MATPDTEMFANLAAGLIAYQMLSQALIATHPEPEKLREEYLRRARSADAVLDALPDPAQVRRYFDSAHAMILTGIQRAGAAPGSI